MRFAVVFLRKKKSGSCLPRKVEELKIPHRSLPKPREPLGKPIRNIPHSPQNSPKFPPEVHKNQRKYRKRKKLEKFRKTTPQKKTHQKHWHQKKHFNHCFSARLCFAPYRQSPTHLPPASPNHQDLGRLILAWKRRGVASDLQWKAGVCSRGFLLRVFLRVF